MGKNSGEFLMNFSELSLKTVIPQKSLILGINSGEFLENFRGVSFMKWFLKNSSEILQRKLPWLENLEKIPHFCYFGQYNSYLTDYWPCSFSSFDFTQQVWEMHIKPLYLYLTEGGGGCFQFLKTKHEKMNNF